MIGVSIRKLEKNNFATHEYYFQCPYCGADQWYQKNAPILCSMCSKHIDSMISVFTEESQFPRITYHMGGVDEDLLKYFPFMEDNSRIKFK